MSKWEFCTVLQHGDSSGIVSSIVSLFRRREVADRCLVVLERSDELGAYRVRMMEPNDGEETTEYE